MPSSPAKDAELYKSRQDFESVFLTTLAQHGENAGMNLGSWDVLLSNQGKRAAQGEWIGEGTL